MVSMSGIMAPSNLPNGADPPAHRSIRSFFQPRTPIYTAPPNLTGTNSPMNASQKPESQLYSTSPHLVQRCTDNSSLPSQASISTILEKHVQPLRRINSLLLPINYPDSFYHKIIESQNTPTNFSHVILWTDSEPKVIGGIVCRLDPAATPGSNPTSPSFIPNTFDIYVQSLALLSPYRNKGLATAVLDAVVEAAVAQDNVTIRELYAHVWSENTEALEWYAARGFKKDEGVMHGYYKRLKPDTAWLLRRRLNPSDHLDHSSALQNTESSPPTKRPSPLELSSAPSSTSPLHPPSAGRPPMPNSARSFQDVGPEREWNDLPEDVVANTLLKPPSAAVSAASSRSSSRSGAGKKRRQYPAAAFGS